MAISFNNQNCSNNKSIKSASINDDGDLVVIYTDSTSEVLGHVVGSDGKNFTPDERGDLIPDGTMFIDKPQGFVYESYANGKVTLYFKTSLPGVTPSTWISAEYGKGDKGDPFLIDDQGTTLPDLTDLRIGYTFYKTDEGNIYQKTAQLVWSAPYRWKGIKGDAGNFVINDSGDTLPDASTLWDTYTFLKEDTGQIYQVYVDGNGTLHWSKPYQWTGKQGDKGDDGSSADALYVISNTVDFSMANTLLVLGTVPAGYVVTNIDANVTSKLNTNVVEMEIRFGGTIQDDAGSIIIAPQDYFDINIKKRYIVNEINHDPSTNDEIVSAIFDYAPLNSDSGIVEIKITVAKQLPKSSIPI